jgi:hypothetical protein
MAEISHSQNPSAVETATTETFVRLRGLKNNGILILDCHLLLVYVFSGKFASSYAGRRARVV